MKFFILVFFFLLNSCTSIKYPYNYFADCEEKFSQFSNLSSCALREIKKDCKDNLNCKNENNRFVDIMKRLQIMVDNKEISENEAMFRYLNLIDLEESKSKAGKIRDYTNYHYHFNDFYSRRTPACYFSRTSFCY